MSAHPFPCAALVGAMLCVSASATAADRSLYEIGKEHVEAGRFAEARAAFEEAIEAPDLQAEHRWRLLLALAYTWEQLTRAEPALRHYQQFLLESDVPAASSGKWAERRTIARESVVKLESVLLKRTGRVDVASTPAGARVDVVPAPEGLRGPPETPLTLYLPPGVHRLSLALEGFVPAASDVDVAIGGAQGVSVALVPEQEPEPEPPALDVAAAPELALGLTATAEPEAPSLVPAWTLLVAGGLAVIAGGVCTSLALDDARAMSALDPALGPVEGPRQWNALHDSVKRYQIAYATLYGVGGAAIAAGTVYALAAGLGGGGDEPVGPDAPSVSLTVSGDGAAAAARWTF